jgi:hypothetical protein
MKVTIYRLITEEQFLSRPFEFFFISALCAGRAIAEAASRWLPTAAAWVRARVWQVGFVVDKVGSGHVFSEHFGFPCQNRSFHQLHHYLNHPGQLAEALRRADHPSKESW